MWTAIMLICCRRCRACGGTGSIRGLRARGGFEVSEAWKDGKLVSAQVKSVGGTRGRLRYDGKTAELALRPGQSVRVTAREGKLELTPILTRP